MIFNLRSELFYVFPAIRLRKGARRTSFSDDPSSAGSYASSTTSVITGKPGPCFPEKPIQKK